MYSAHFRMLIRECLNKDTYIVPEEDPLNILDGNSGVCMTKNCKDTKHTRLISIIPHFVSNGEN